MTRQLKGFFRCPVRIAVIINILFGETGKQISASALLGMTMDRSRMPGINAKLAMSG
jgi:hypothetical protein